MGPDPFTCLEQNTIMRRRDESGPLTHRTRLADSFCRPACDEPGGKHNMLPGDRFPIDHPEQHVRGTAGHGLCILVNAGDGRIIDIGEGRIIISCELQHFRYPDSHFKQAEKCAYGQQVICAGESVDVRILCCEFPDCGRGQRSGNAVHAECFRVDSAHGKCLAAAFETHHMVKVHTLCIKNGDIAASGI